MAAHGARRLLRMNANLAVILGAEALCAAQGIGFRAPLTTSPRLAAAVDALRAQVPPLGADRYLAPEIEAAVTIPFLHLADTTAYAVRAAGVRTVGLLGTAFTMEQTFYRNRLASHGLTVMVPSAEDRALVHRVIYEELCLGIVRDGSRDVFRAIIDRLVAAGADGIILGCTEIEILISGEDSSVPVFPTTRLHVEAVVTASLAP